MKLVCVTKASNGPRFSC